MLQRWIWLAFLLVLAVGIIVSIRIVSLGDSVQAINQQFISEKLPLSQSIGELRGAIADCERLLYEYYSYTASRDAFNSQRVQIQQKIDSLLNQVEHETGAGDQMHELRLRLTELGELSTVLSETLDHEEVNWDLARAILAQVKPKVREIEKTLAVISVSNQNTVDNLGREAQSNISTMIQWVVGFSALIFGVSFFVGYYVVLIIREGRVRRRLAMFPEWDPNSVLRLDTHGAVLYSNPATTRLLEKLGQEFSGSATLLPDDLQQYLVDMRRMKVTNTIFQYSRGAYFFECTLAYLTDFSEYHAYIKDITERELAREKLTYQAYFDQATGLPNQYRLREDITEKSAHINAGCVMMIVVDREQEIFVHYGAVVTEKWLIKTARRLQDHIHMEDEKLYRFGSNAFVLLCRTSDLNEAQRRAQKLLGVSQQPLSVEGHEIISTLSIGASLQDDDSSDGAIRIGEDHIQQAVSACNRVRRAGGNDIAVYNAAMGQIAAKALRLATELNHAIENRELRLHYQPKVDAVSGQLVGMEALVRWIHPVHGMISPVEFIPIAEDTGLIVEIGSWVLRQACTQNAAWLSAGMKPLRVAVNLSARQFRSNRLIEDIDRILAATSLPANLLELEITESMVMDDPEGVIGMLDVIRSRGIHIALDDFGTGHSSLAYLKRFPIDSVKIDRAFIKELPRNRDDISIVKTIIAMAKNLDLSVVAEGVETEAQYELLKQLGCDQIQGYYFSSPLDTDQFAEYSRSRPSGHSHSVSGL